ncbi:MAG TPA: hypothetical protein PLD20_28075 [Blastocatellia bacterium]|nr:hypothetical protein [Blastocatellia bacterium]HMX24378.1 hypothetical protein [Blastocatellia bacterium]HMZ21822.1 hypothetical protein [Blastocatellia bacterium]HNG34036.1 hypothetical protein [Blastocatellia bacterium]
MYSTQVFSVSLILKSASFRWWDFRRRKDLGNDKLSGTGQLAPFVVSVRRIPEPSDLTAIFSKNTA